MENPGILSLIQVDEDEEELFLDYMHCLKETEDYDILYDIFEDDFWQFLDVYAGESIRVPRRGYLNKVVKYVRIYKHCEARDFSDESIRVASKIFGRRKSSIRRAINKVERVLAKGRVDEKEDDEDE